MHLRNEFIAECFEGKLTMTELCEKYGISRKTGYKLRNRVWEHGVDGLADRTSRPHTNPRSWSPESVEFFLHLREKHRTWGPRKLRAVAQEKYSGSQLPAASTIGEWLRRHGLVRPRRRRRRATPSELSLLAAQAVSFFSRDGGGAVTPLESAKRALDGNRPESEGFVRDNAWLVIVVISNEDDASPDSPSAYADTLKSLKADPSDVLVAVVTQPGNTPCRASSTSSRSAAR